MKLYRFTASNNQKALMKIHTALGPDALIYTTRKILNGVEILAGPSSIDDVPVNSTNLDKASMTEVQVDNNLPNYLIIKSLNNKIHAMDENILQLTNYISTLHEMMSKSAKKRKFINWNFLKNFMRSKKPMVSEIYEKPSIQQ